MNPLTIRTTGSETRKNKFNLLFFTKDSLHDATLLKLLLKKRKMTDEREVTFQPDNLIWDWLQ